MRKTVKRSDTELAPEKASWLDVSAIARVGYDFRMAEAVYAIEDFPDDDLLMDRRRWLQHQCSE